MEHYNRSSSNRRGSNSRYGNSRSSYGRGGRSGGRRNGFGNSQRIDVNKFVKKAQEKTETVEYKPSFKFADLEVNQI